MLFSSILVTVGLSSVGCRGDDDSDYSIENIGVKYPRYGFKLLRKRNLSPRENKNERLFLHLSLSFFFPPLLIAFQTWKRPILLLCRSDSLAIIAPSCLSISFPSPSSQAPADYTRSGRFSCVVDPWKLRRIPHSLYTEWRVPIHDATASNFWLTTRFSRTLFYRFPGNEK